MRSTPIPGQMRQSKGSLSALQMQPVRTGQGPSPQQHLERGSFLDLGQPGHTHDPVFCGASEALRGGTSLRGLEVLVQCLHFRDEVSEVSDPTASKKQKWESNPVIRTLILTSGLQPPAAVAATTCQTHLVFLVTQKQRWHGSPKTVTHASARQSPPAGPPPKHDRQDSMTWRELKRLLASSCLSLAMNSGAISLPRTMANRNCCGNLFFAIGHKECIF